MKPSGLCDLEFEDYVGDDGEPRLLMASASTGLVLDANCGNTVDDFGQQPHTTRIVARTNDLDITAMPGLGFEKSMFPDTKTMPGLGSSDSTPPSDVHWTGGGNRCFAPRVCQWLFRGLTAHQLATGLSTLRTWVTAELMNRPIAHGPPRNFREDLKINPGTPYAWSSEQKTKVGWNAYDVAHAHWDYEALLAMHGDLMGAACFVLKWSWLVIAHPPETKHWRNQERAMACAIVNDIYATELGLCRGDTEGNDKLFRNRAPKKCLNDRVMVLVQNYDALQAGWQADLDNRKLPTLNAGKDWKGFGPQLQGQYGPMNAQLIFAIGKALLSGLLRPEVAEAVLPILRRHSLHLVRMASSAGSARAAFSCGTTDFPDQATADLAIAEGAALGFPAKGADPIESVQVGDKWRVRSVTEMQDVEILAGALVVANEAHQSIHGQHLDSEVEDYIALAIASLPKVDSNLFNQSSKSYAKYLLPAVALSQASVFV